MCSWSNASTLVFAMEEMFSLAKDLDSVWYGMCKPKTQICDISRAITPQDETLYFKYLEKRTFRDSEKELRSENDKLRSQIRNMEEEKNSSLEKEGPNTENEAENDGLRRANEILRN